VPMTYRARNGNQYEVIAGVGTNRFRMIANSADERADSLAVRPQVTMEAKESGGELVDGAGEAEEARAVVGYLAGNYGK